MKASQIILPVFALFALGSASRALGQATEAFTDPVGFVAVTAKGNSDTRFAVPLHRSSVFTGVVSAVNGGIITVQGAPGWTGNQFVYAAGTQTNRYYVEFQTEGSALEGKFYDVTANGSDTLTLSLGSDTLTAGAIGEVVTIIPHWTFSTLFPSQAGITAAASVSGAAPATKIQIPDTASAGTNLVNAFTYYYFNGATSGGPGWRRAGGGLSTIRNDDIVRPTDYVVVRQDQVATDAVLAGTGAVPMSKRTITVGTKQASTAQDNFIEIDIPVPMTLSQSGLFESGAFVSTSSISGASGDKLLVYDDSVVQINKVPTKTYYYFNGSTNGGPGWRRQGGGLSNIVNNEVVFQPGSGVIIRKQAVASPGTFVWSPLPTYLTP